MRKKIILLTTILFSFTLLISIFNKENILKSGEVVRLELAPLDPRSLIQGDYMKLRFKIVDDIRKVLMKRKSSKNSKKAVIVLNDKKIASFKRIYDNKPLKEGELLLNFQTRKYLRIKISTDSYFFQEGKGKIYQKARYGEFRVAKSGEALLTHLLDRNLTIL